MIVLLDIGNTSVKWTVLDHGVMNPGGCFRHQGNDFGTLARAAWGGLQAPERIVVSNVAGSRLGDSLAAWVMEHWGLAPVFVRAAAMAFGVANAYERPADLGVDRWVALIGAHSCYNGALCIVDCGTAITLDFLAADGVHKGGLILPGVAMLEQLLLKNTAGIAPSAVSGFTTPFARGTGDAVHGGAVYMVSATIDRIIEDMGAAAGERPELIITGGDAVRIQPLLSRPSQPDPQLVLKGLAILAGET